MPINKLRQQHLFDNYGLTLHNPDTETQDPFDQVDFGANEQPDYFTAPTSSDTDTNEPSVDWIKRMDEMYKPETRATNRFETLLDAPPEEEQPSFMRKLVASGVAWDGGVDAANKVLHDPHERAMADWKAKEGADYQAANLERQNNINERQLAGQTVSAQINQQKADETERKNRETADITRVKNDAYAFKQYHPDWKINFDGPSIMAVSPDGKQAVNLGPSGHMSDIDKMNLTQKNELARIEARGTEAQETKATVPGGSSGGLNNVTKERGIVLQALWDSRPDLHKYITPPSTANGSWQISDPPAAGWFSNVDPAEMAKYNEVRKAMGYGDLGSSSQPSSQVQPQAHQGPSISAAQPHTALPPAHSNTSPVQTQITGLDPGYVKIQVIGTNEIVQIPESNLQRALLTGKYRQVQ